MKLKLGLRPPCSRFNNCLLVYFNGDPPTARPPPPPLLPGGGPGGGRRGEAQGTPSAPGHGGGCCGRAPLWGPGRCSRGAAPLGARGQWQPSALRRVKEGRGKGGEKKSFVLSGRDFKRGPSLPRGECRWPTLTQTRGQPYRLPLPLEKKKKRKKKKEKKTPRDTAAQTHGIGCVSHGGEMKMQSFPCGGVE